MTAHDERAHPVPGRPASRPARRLLAAVAALVGLDAVGGLVAVADGLSTTRQAWGPEARLAAPWPMVVAQVVLAAVAAGRPRRPAVVAAALLAVACLVSAVSGFFDGGLADDRLTPRHRALQTVLIGWTTLVGLLAAGQAREAHRAVASRAR